MVLWFGFALLGFTLNIIRVIPISKKSENDLAREKIRVFYGHHSYLVVSEVYSGCPGVDLVFIMVSMKSMGMLLVRRS